MSILSTFKDTLENVSPLNVYLEYDTTPLTSRGIGFVIVGINSEECSYGIKNSVENFSKDRISFSVKVVMSKGTNSKVLDNYFNDFILNTILKSNDYNVISVKKDKPYYTKYLDRMELDSTILIECISKFA